MCGTWCSISSPAGPHSRGTVRLTELLLAARAAVEAEPNVLGETPLLAAAAGAEMAATLSSLIIHRGRANFTVFSNLFIMILGI